MQQQLLPWVLFTISALAQDIRLPVSGPNKAGFAGTPNGLRVLETNGRTPNATTSVPFNRTYNGTIEQWRWRVNVTDIAVPDSISSIGRNDVNFTQGLRVANTQWQLEWPASVGQTLEGSLRARDGIAYFTALISNKPWSITDGYSDDNDGDCAPILGEECVESLTEAASRGTVLFTGLEGCEDTLIPNDGGSDDGASFGKLCLFSTTPI